MPKNERGRLDARRSGSRCRKNPSRSRSFGFWMSLFTETSPRAGRPRGGLHLALVLRVAAEQVGKVEHDVVVADLRGVDAELRAAEQRLLVAQPVRPAVVAEEVVGAVAHLAVVGQHEAAALPF